MKVLSGWRFLLIGVSAMVVVGCSAPEPQQKVDGMKIASAKCNRSDAPLGSLIKSCSTPQGSQEVDKQEFMQSLQTPGAVPQR